MSEAAIADLDRRVTSLESVVTSSLNRIEGLIRQEIQDLKSEQLKDIKETIDRVERDLKSEHSRLADDQRRLWDRVTDLERRENQRLGTDKTIGRFGNFMTALIAAAVTWMATWYSKGTPPHP